MVVSYNLAQLLEQILYIIIYCIVLKSDVFGIAHL